MLKKIVTWYKNRSNRKLLANAPRDRTGHPVIGSGKSTHLNKRYVLQINNERGAARSILEGTFNLNQLIEAGLPESLIRVISHMSADYQAANNNQKQMKQAWTKVFQLKDGNMTVQQRVLELQLENANLRRQLREVNKQPASISKWNKAEALAQLLLDAEKPDIERIG